MAGPEDDGAEGVDLDSGEADRSASRSLAVRPPEGSSLDLPSGEPTGRDDPTFGDLAVMAAESALALSALSLRVAGQTMSAAGSVLERALDRQTTRTPMRAAAAAMSRPARQGREDLRDVARRAERGVGRMVGALAPAVAESVEIEPLLERVDVNAILASIDVNELVGRVDMNRVFEQLDLERVLDQLDLNALLSRIDIQELLAQVDVEELLEDVDLDALLERIDLDAILERVDLEALMVRANVGELVAQSTSEMAGSTLDLARRQAVGLDTVLARLINRALRRSPDDLQPGPPRLVQPETGDEA